MPITSSAKKALSASKRKHIFNIRRKVAIDKNLKDFRKLVVSKNKIGAEEILPLVYKALDKAAKTGQIKHNASARLKSRAAAALKKIS